MFSDNEKQLFHINENTQTVKVIEKGFVKLREITHLSIKNILVNIS